MKTLFIYFSYFLFAICLIAFFITISAIIKKAKSNNNILKNGISTVATIVNVKQNPGGTGGFIYALLDISFITKENLTIMTTVKARIAILDIKNYQPGKELKIKYIESSPKKAIVDYSYNKCN